jgi:hypothetical protein
MMQLVQLIQYAKIESFSMSLSNKIINVSISPNDLRAYGSLDFDTSLFNKDDDCFSFDINTPIPMVQYRDSYTWGKYCQRFMELDFHRERQVNNNLHGSFRSSMINFLQTDIAGTLTYSMNPKIFSQLQQFLLKFSDSELDKQQISSVWDKKLENKLLDISDSIKNAPRKEVSLHQLLGRVLFSIAVEG